MKMMLNARTFTLLAMVALLCLPVFWACSDTADLQTQVSGKWQSTQDNGIVAINLTGDPKSLIINGQSYDAVVESVDQGTYTVQVKVQTPTGQSEVWFLSQKWNDNGSSFKLAFRHNGTTETLVPVARS